MKYHLTGDESWMRCVATKRPGQNVSLCQLGTAENSHVFGRAGIAAQGGGIESRWENGARIDIRISSIADDGTFTATSKKGFKRIYKDDGVLMTLRARARKGPALLPVDKKKKATPEGVTPTQEVEVEVNKSFKNDPFDFYKIGELPWHNAFVTWSRSRDTSKNIIEAIYERFGDRAIAVLNWVYDLQEPAAAKQRNILAEALTKRVTKNGTAHKIELGDPFMKGTEVAAQDSFFIQANSRREMLEEITQLLDDGRYKTIRLHRYSPASKKFKAAMRVTVEHASMEEMVDLV